MSWTKTGLVLLLIAACGFSFAVGGMTAWLAGPSGGEEIYRIGKQSFTKDSLAEEFAITLRMSSQFTPGQRIRLATNMAFRSIWLNNRFLADVLAANAEASGWLETPACQAWMRLAVREAVRQFVLVHHLTDVSVSSNEKIAWYDAHARSLQHLPLDEGLLLAGERVLLEKRQEALVRRTMEQVAKLGAVLVRSNF